MKSLSPLTKSLSIVILTQEETQGFEYEPLILVDNFPHCVYSNTLKFLNRINYKAISFRHYFDESIIKQISSNMKKVCVLLVTLIISAAAMAQATPHEKQVIKSDLEKERIHRDAVAGNLLRGRPHQAKAQHRAAVAAHKRTKRDLKAMHHNDMKHARRHQ